MTKQQFDIGTYFTIQYYAKKHNKTGTRRGKWSEDCEENEDIESLKVLTTFEILTFKVLILRDFA